MNNDYEEEIEENETEEEEQKEEEKKLSTENVDDVIPVLGSNITNMVRNRGFYIVKNKPLAEIDENNEEIDTDDDDEENGNKKKFMQLAEPIAASALMDLTKKPYEIKEEFAKENLIFCDGNGEIYYGKLKVYNYEDKLKNDRHKIIPNGKGRIYKNGKSIYAGYFSNGRKTTGVTFNENNKTLHNHKGDECIERHNEKDLLLSFEGKNYDKDKIESNKNKYNNIMRYSIDNYNCVQIDTQDKQANNLNNVENITIQIDNCYKHDFRRKYNDFVDDNGNVVKYSPEDVDKMVINVDAMVEALHETISKCKNLKNIEIVCLNNYGFLKDKEGKELIKEFFKQARQILYDKKVKIHIKNVSKKSVVDDAVEQYIGNETTKSVMANEFNYYYYDAESGKTSNFDNEEQYQQSLIESNYYNNTRKINTEGQNVNNLKYAFYDIDTSYDRNDEENTKYIRNNKNELSNKTKENYKLSLTKPIPIEVNKQKKRSLSPSEIACVVIASILLPIIGGYIVYSFLSQGSTVNDIINEKHKNTKAQQNVDDKNEEEEQKNDDLYQSENKNIQPNENLSNLDNHNNGRDQVIV